MTLSSLDTTLEVHEIPMLDSCWMMMIPVILGCKPPLKRMPINRDLVTTLEEAGLLNYPQACTVNPQFVVSYDRRTNQLELTSGLDLIN